MDERIVFILILFVSLLLKAILHASTEKAWSDIKVRKLYVYLSINLALLVAIMGLNSEFANFRHSIHDNLRGLVFHSAFDPSVLVLSAIYLLAILALFLSYKTWPFAAQQRGFFKTLILVLAVVLVVEAIYHWGQGTIFPTPPLI